MIKAGVIGHPIQHSLSPKLHNYWLKKYGIDGEYKAYDVAPENLGAFIAGMKDKGLSGCNVTIPHKEAVMQYMDELDDVAEDVGAVNTIILKDGKLLGSNTDVSGFYENVKPHLTGTNKAFILGAGGAAKGVAVALRKLGFDTIMISNRTQEKASELADKQGLQLVDWEQKDGSLKEVNLLVNTTSLGLAGNLPLDLDLAALPITALVTDIVYKPLITPLLAEAKARGNKIVDGLGMLLYQAAPGFEAWFGVKPEVTDELRNYIVAA